MDTVIRPVGVGDAEALLEIYAPAVRTTAISFELEPPTPAEFRKRIAVHSRAAPWLVCTSDGRVAGYAYATPFRARPAYQWSVEVTVYVADGFRRRGVARGLYTTLFELLRLQGFMTAVGVIALPNPASVALHESLGFEPVGVFPRIGYKFGAWHDTGWWVKPLHAEYGVPREIMPATTVLESAAGREAMIRL